MIMMHGLQLVLWVNPGPFYCPMKISLPDITITLPEILLIDLNGLISMEGLQFRSMRELVRFVNWVAGKQEKEGVPDQAEESEEFDEEMAECDKGIQNTD